MLLYYFSALTLVALVIAMQLITSKLCHPTLGVTLMKFEHLPLLLIPSAMAKNYLM